VLSRPPMLPAPTPPVTPRSACTTESDTPPRAVVLHQELKLLGIGQTPESSVPEWLASAERVLRSSSGENTPRSPEERPRVSAHYEGGAGESPLCSSASLDSREAGGSCGSPSNSPAFPSPPFVLPAMVEGGTPVEDGAEASVERAERADPGIVGTAALIPRREPADPPLGPRLWSGDQDSTEAAEARAHAEFTRALPPPDVVRARARHGGGRHVVTGGFVTAASVSAAIASSSDARDPVRHESADKGGREGGAVPFREEALPDEEEAEAARLYGVLLQGAAAADPELDVLGAEGVAYLSGPDRHGRPALVLVGCRIHGRCATAASRRLLLLYLVRLLNTACGPDGEPDASPARAAAAEGSRNRPRGREFTVVLLATAMPADRAGPTFDFLRDVFSGLPLSLTRRLSSLHLVHPALRTRLAFAILGIMLWGRLTFVDRLEQLRRAFPPGSLLLPDFVLQYDFIRDIKRNPGAVVGGGGF